MARDTSEITDGQEYAVDLTDRRVLERPAETLYVLHERDSTVLSGLSADH